MSMGGAVGLEPFAGNEVGIKRGWIVCCDITFCYSTANRLNRTMKFLVLSLALALVLTTGSALNCHRCVSRRAGESCDLVVESCRPEKDACAAAKFLSAPHGQYQKCMAMSDCEMLKMNSYIDMKCCADNMCNTF
ncbi:unnamed protein product [Boreogadus saida]